jgi:hypothetical protein
MGAIPSFGLAHPDNKQVPVEDVEHVDWSKAHKHHHRGLCGQTYSSFLRILMILSCFTGIIDALLSVSHKTTSRFRARFSDLNLVASPNVRRCSVLHEHMPQNYTSNC